jgi:hypothetical protein
MVPCIPYDVGELHEDIVAGAISLLAIPPQIRELPLGGIRGTPVPEDTAVVGVVGVRSNHAQPRVLGVADLHDRERGVGRRGRRRGRRRRRRRPRGRRGRPGRLLRREHDQVDATVWRRVARAHRGAIARSTESLRRWHPDPAVVADAVDPAPDARRHVDFQQPPRPPSPPARPPPPPTRPPPPPSPPHAPFTVMQIRNAQHARLRIVAPTTNYATANETVWDGNSPCAASGAQPSLCPRGRLS